MIYKHKYLVGLNNVNSKYKITNKAILEFLENSAAMNALAVNEGIEDANHKNKTFLINEWDLQVLIRPKFTDKIEINSWIYNKEGKYSYCNFEGYVNNQKVFVAVAKMVLFDLLDQTVIPVSEAYLKHFKPENNQVIDMESLPKIVIPETFEESKNVMIRKSDIDINNHVHNLVYLDYLKELCDNDYDNLRIIYLKEVKYEDKITINKNDNIGIIKANDIISSIIKWN